MQTAEIPNQTAHEAYQAIAERRGTTLAASDRQDVSEAEFTAALAYVLGLPLLEPEDLSATLLSECRTLTAELEMAALREYQFVPIAQRRETLVVISCCPWDTVAAEVLLGYYPQCTRLKFVLTNRACLQELLSRLSPVETKPLTADAPAGTAIVLPPGSRPVAPESPGETAAPANEHLLTPEDVVRIMNVLAAEIQSVTRRPSRGSL